MKGPGREPAHLSQRLWQRLGSLYIKWRSLSSPPPRCQESAILVYDASSVNPAGAFSECATVTKPQSRPQSQMNDFTSLQLSELAWQSGLVEECLGFPCRPATSWSQRGSCQLIKYLLADGSIHFRLVLINYVVPDMKWLPFGFGSFKT